MGKEEHDSIHSKKNNIINVEAHKDETSEKFKGINNLKREIEVHLGANEMDNPPIIDDEAEESIIEIKGETTFGGDSKKVEDEFEATETEDEDGAIITSEELFEINLGTDEKEELKMKDEIDYKDEMTTESSKVILRQHLEELENFVESVDNKSEDGFEDFMESIKNLKVESEKNKDKIKNEPSRINNEYRNNLKEIENKIEAIIKAL